MATHNSNGSNSNGSKAQAAQAKANVAQAKVQAQAPAPQVATPQVATPAPQAKPVGVRTLPGAVLAALVARGATVQHCAANPKRVGSKAHAAWPTMAKAPTVALGAQGPLGAADMAYALAHGQAQASLPGIGAVGAPIGQPLTVAGLAALRAALGMA